MKLKKFENFINEMNIEDEVLLNSFSNFDKFRHGLLNHKDYETCDLIAVYVGDKFIENDNGSYSKSYEPLTAILKITPDKSSFSNVNGMKFRGKTQDASGMMILQWVDKDISDSMIDSINKGDEDSDFYLSTLVNHYKQHSLGKR